MIWGYPPFQETFIEGEISIWVWWTNGQVCGIFSDFGPGWNSCCQCVWRKKQHASSTKLWQSIGIWLATYEQSQCQIIVHSFLKVYQTITVPNQCQIIVHIKLSAVSWTGGSPDHWLPSHGHEKHPGHGGFLTRGDTYDCFPCHHGCFNNWAIKHITIPYLIEISLC